MVQFNQRSPEATGIVLLEGESPEEWGIGLKKNNAALLKEVNAFLAEFKASKGMQKLLEKHIADPGVREAVRVPGQ